MVQIGSTKLSIMMLKKTSLNKCESRGHLRLSRNRYKSNLSIFFILPSVIFRKVIIIPKAV